MGSDYKVTLTAKGKNLYRLGWHKPGFSVFSNEVRKQNLIRAFPSLDYQNVDKAFDIYKYDVLSSRFSFPDEKERPDSLICQTENSITVSCFARKSWYKYELHTLANMYPDIEFTGEVLYGCVELQNTYKSVGGTLLITMMESVDCIIDSSKYSGNSQEQYQITDDELKSDVNFVHYSKCTDYNSLTGNFQIRLGKKITDYLYFNGYDYHYLEPYGCVTNIGEESERNPSIYWNKSSGKLYEVLPDNKVKYLGKASNKLEYFDVIYYVN